MSFLRDIIIYRLIGCLLKISYGFSLDMAQWSDQCFFIESV